MTTPPFSADTRAENLAHMATAGQRTEPLDVLVIGGGITGAGLLVTPLDVVFVSACSSAVTSPQAPAAGHRS